MLLVLLLLWLNPPIKDDTWLIGYQRTVLVTDHQTQLIINLIRQDPKYPAVCAITLQKQFEPKGGRGPWNYDAYMYWCNELQLVPDWLPKQGID